MSDMITQAQWIREFNDTNRPKFNMELFERDNYEIITDLQKVILSCQRDFYFTIKVESFEVVEQYDLIHQILFKYEQDKVANKKGDAKNKFDNPYQYIDTKDSDIMLLIVNYYVAVNDPEAFEEERFQVIIKVPRIVDKYYYRLKGCLYSAIYQIVDGSTYNNTSSNSKKHSVTFKTIFMPTILYRNVYTDTDYNDNEVKYTIFVSRIFSKNVPGVEYILAKYGLNGALIFLGVQNVISVSDIYNDDPNYYYFHSNDIYIEVPKEVFDGNIMVQCITMTLYRHISSKYPANRVASYKDVITNEYWLESLALRFSSIPTVEKGLSILDSFESIYDLTTKDDIKLEDDRKKDIYCIMRWVMQQFSYHRLKDNNDISTKKIRRGYMAARYSMKMSKGIYRASDSQKKIKCKDIKRYIFTEPDFFINSIIKDKLVMFRDNANDNDSFNAIKFSYKGVSGLGEQKGATIPDSYRHVYPSHLGRIDVDTSSASDPGLSGMICPLAPVVDNSFCPEGFNEKDDWDEEFNELVKEYVDMKGKRDLVKFHQSLDDLVVAQSQSERQLQEIEACIMQQEETLKMISEVDSSTSYNEVIEFTSGDLVIFDDEMFIDQTSV